MAISWVLYTDAVVGQGHPSLSDIVNRPLRNVLSDSGYASDGSDWAGFAKATHAHSAADITSGTLGVARGGTGVATIPLGNLLLGAVAAAMTLLAPGAAGGYVRSDGSSWARQSGVAAADVVAGTFPSGAFTFTTPLSDSNLAQLTTAGKVANSATTAASANTVSAIVARDGSGNFSAGTISAALSGNASTASTLATPRTLWSVSFDGSANVSAAPTFGAGATVSNGQTLALGTSTVSGTPTWSSGQTFPSPTTVGGVTFNAGAVASVTTLAGGGALSGFTTGVFLSTLQATKLGLGMVASNILDITQSANSNSDVKILNATAGTAAQVRFNATSDAGTLVMGATSTLFTPTAIQPASAAFVFTSLATMTLGVSNGLVATLTAAGLAMNTLAISGVSTLAVNGLASLNASAIITSNLGVAPSDIVYTLKIGNITTASGIARILFDDQNGNAYTASIDVVKTGGNAGQMALRTFNGSVLTSAVTISSAQIMNLLGSTDASSLSTGILQVAGGMSVAKTIYGKAIVARPATADGIGGITIQQQNAGASVESALNVLHNSAGFGWRERAINSDGSYQLDVQSSSVWTTNIVHITSTLIELNVATTIVGGLVSGSATGGNKGNGTINIASDIYKNNTAYTNPDYVFEAIFTGDVQRFLDNPGAVAFRDEFIRNGKRLLTIDEDRAFAREHLHLPGIGRGTAGAFGRADMALREIEVSRAYIWELHDRVSGLENATQAVT